MFSDASERHFATTAYLHFQFDNIASTTKLIMAKSKVKPSKTNLSIPRLELMGIEIAANAAVTLVKELSLDKLNSIRFFSDSMIALYWVLKRKKLTKFVDNRVGKIHENIQILEKRKLKTLFHHCPTDQNPADIASRGSGMDKLFKNKLWFEGPEFLRKQEKEWPVKLEGTIEFPKQFREIIEKETKGTELTKRVKTAILTAVATSHTNQSIIRYTTARSLEKLTSTMTMVFRWFLKTFPNKDWKSKVFKELKTSKNDQINQRLITKDFILADHYIDYETKGGIMPKNLKLKKDERGVFRHPRNLDSSKLSNESKEPILLMRGHPLTSLIIRDIHRENVHIPASYMPGAVYQKYWVNKLGLEIRKVLKRCYRCKRQSGQPFSYPYAQNLPTCRTISATPFSQVGLDYFGPVSYTGAMGIKKKTWVLLITCLITRAVHLELVTDNSTITYLMALKRYFGRRGVPKTILCDNAPGFLLGNKMINDDIRNRHHSSDTLTTFLATKEIELKNITPLSPWQGGIYERIVGIIKNQFYKTVCKAELSYIELETIMIEVEAAVNSRPITTNPTTPDDPAALRPVDFLIPNINLAVPNDCDMIYQAKEGQIEKLTRKYHAALNCVLENLWSAWTKHYLLTIKESKQKRHNFSAIKPREGQLVLVNTEKMPRHKWPLAQIKKVLTSADGEIRSAYVKIKNKMLLRSVKHLIPLEIDNESENIESERIRDERVATAADEPTPIETQTEGERVCPNTVRKTANSQKCATAHT
uniref:Integrase catalytic domain-containing protein n=1 Tax=Caenorhabditis japonica TaxID=281687 RepID=A0A8R1IA90_CAEJA